MQHCRAQLAEIRLGLGNARQGHALLLCLLQQIVAHSRDKGIAAAGGVDIGGGCRDVDLYSGIICQAHLDRLRAMGANDQFTAEPMVFFQAKNFMLVADYAVGQLHQITNLGSGQLIRVLARQENGERRAGLLPDGR